MLENILKKTDRTLTFTRAFAAPRELVFDAFTKPEHLKNWWMPAGCEMTNQELDLAPGGEWTYTVKVPSGDFHYAKAVYREIERPDRLVFDDMFVTPSGETISDLPQKHVIITFEESTTGTLLTVQVQMQTKAELAKLVQMRFVPGFTQALGQLDQLLTRIK